MSVKSAFDTIIKQLENLKENATEKDREIIELKASYKRVLAENEHLKLEIEQLKQISHS